MSDLTKTYRSALQSILASNMTGVKLTLRKSFKTMYSDKWASEEARMDAIFREMKSALNFGDTRRIQDSIDAWKSFMLVDGVGESGKISEVNLRSFLNTSDGRYYGGAFSDFMNLIRKLDCSGSSYEQGNKAAQPVRSNSPSTTSNATKKPDNMLYIEHPLTGGKLQVANKDFSQEMNWKDAKRACNELGSGWRLPTIEELKAMYEQLHKKGMGNFESAHYWSSSEDDNNVAWYFNFYAEYASNYSKTNADYVCAVRAF